MSRIIPSLNLNKTPQSVEDRSLVYAKNIRMFPDQTFGPDNSIVTKVDTDNISKYLGKEDGTLYDIIGHINGINNNIYLFVSKYKAVQSVYYGDISNLENITSVNVKTYSKNNDNTKNVIIEKNLTFEELPLEVYKMLQCSVVPYNTTEKALFDLTKYINKEDLSEYTIQEEEVNLLFNMSNGNIDCIQITDPLISIADYSPEIISYNNDSYIKYQVESDIYIYKIKNILYRSGGSIYTPEIVNKTLIFTNTDNIVDSGGHPENLIEESTFVTINNEIYIVTHVNIDNPQPICYKVVGINYYNNSEVLEYNYPFYFNYACNIIEEGKFNKIGSLSLQKKSIEEDNEENTNEEVEEKIVGFTIKVNNTFYNNLYIELSYYNNNELVKSVDEKLSDEKIKVKDTILEYSELTEDVKEIKSGWKWSGGIIEGVTTVNNTNQPILNIGEYFEQDTDINVPIKHINVKECKETDDESIYTQAPNVPLTNFRLIDTFTHSIPNGVYQFFVRYKIRDNFYTNWFVCSKECFAGSRELTNTIFGSLLYTKTDGDAGSSFVFSVEHLHPEYFKLYQGYQIGFILTTNEKTVARSWKTFTFTGANEGKTDTVYFDLNEKDIQEVDIDEMMSTPYNIYNAKNIDYFRGKLYISNYKEDDFNPNNLGDYINKINIDLKFKHFTISQTNDFFDGKLLTQTEGSGLNNYTKIQDKPIRNILSWDKCLALIYGEPVQNSKIDYDFNSPLFYLRTVWNSRTNPDLAYIDIANGISTLGIPLFNDEGRQGDWRYGDVFFEYDVYLSRDANIRERGDDRKHWLKGNKYFDGIWYWTAQGNNFGQDFHIINDNGIGTPTAVNNYINSLTSKLYQAVNENCPNRCIVTKIDVSLNNGTETKTIFSADNHNRNDRHNLVGEQYQTVNTTEIGKFALRKLAPYVSQLNSAGYFYFNDNGTDKLINEIRVEYSVIDYNVKNEADWSNPFATGDQGYNCLTKIDSSKVNYTLSIICMVNTALFKKASDDVEANQYNTLMPYTDYDFYIHYITKNGVITNGIYICSKKVTNFEVESTIGDGINKSLIYPEITGIEIPEGYKSCFISYYKHNNNVAECFDLSLPAQGVENDTIKCNMLEADMLLYKLNTNIQIYHRRAYNDVPIIVGDYYSSNSTKSDNSGKISFSEFGNAGIIKGKYNGNYDINGSINEYYTNFREKRTVWWNNSVTYQGNVFFKFDDFEDDNEWNNIQSFITIDFNTNFEYNNDGSPIRSVSPENIGNTNITLLLDEKYGNYPTYVDSFLKAVFYTGNDAETVWNNFYNSLPNGDNYHFLSLHNFKEFAQNTSDADHNSQIYCQIKKLSDTDGLRDTPIITSVRQITINGYTRYEINFDYSGSKIGIPYKKNDNTEGIIPINKVNIIIGYLGYALNVPKNPKASSERISKDLATEAFQHANSHYVNIDGTERMLYAGYEVKPFIFKETSIDSIDGDIWYRNKAYLSIDETAKKLIKLTPYLTQKDGDDSITFDSYTDMNTDSYICQVTKPDRGASLATYAAGNDLYTITRDRDSMPLNSVDAIVVSTASKIRYIYSNFNLNYMSLSYDLIPKLRANLNHQQLYLSPESAELSNCYKLESMYKDFARKYFAPYNKYNMTVFDNTVRSSDANTDEAYRCIYRFDAEDMYNVPANRGKITKMFSIANAIYIHTEHSLFKFSGENTLSGSENDVKLEESNVFDTGISEIFDSENGYGGLHEKHNCLITYKNYFFYDTRSKLIYVYTGSGELQNINEPIKKLFNFLEVNDVKFGSDLRNDRVFVYLEGTKGNVCLSYNPETKHYVSIHDINIIDTFSTRNNLYFISKELIDKKDRKSGTISLLNGFDYNAFGNYGKVFAQSPYVTNKELALISATSNQLYCVIDVIINSNPETIKNLDSVDWICHHIKNYLDIITSGDYQYYNMENAAEEAKYKYPGEYIQLYTDSCDTGDIEMYDISARGNTEEDVYGANAYSINDTLSYKYPRYNEGVWSLNYFRNIKGVTNNIADNKSLIYGKYIVARFIFKADYNFKLENVMFNIKSR